MIYVAEEKGIIYSVKITPNLGHYSPDVHIGVVYNGSLVPIAAKTAGISFNHLVVEILKTSLSEQNLSLDSEHD